MAAAAARRRRVRRRPDGQRARGTRRRAPRQGSRAVRRERDQGQPRLADGPPAARPRGDRRRDDPHRHGRGRRPRGRRRRDDPRPPERADGTHGPGGRSTRRSATRRPPRADHRAGRRSRTRTRTPAAGRCRSTTSRDGGRPSPTSAASRCTSTAPGSSTPSSPSASAARELAAPADSVTFCLSKGLSTPIGSVVVGSAPFVARARRARKLLGGGMRQVGRAGRGRARRARATAPDGTIARLAEDHANARRLAEGLARLDGIRSPGGIAQPGDGPLDPERTVTNFVLFRVDRDRSAFLAALEARGVLLVPYAHGQVRAVTHLGITGARRRPGRRRGRRRPARHRAPARPVSRPPRGAPDRRRAASADRAAAPEDPMTALLPSSRSRGPRPAPTTGRSTRSSTTSSRRGSGASSSTTRSSRPTSASTTRTTGWATPSRDGPRAEIAEDRAHLAADRGHRPGAALGRGAGSSGTSRSTTSGSPCSRRTRSAAGSGARPRPATSATPSSCCSPAARRRSPSGSSGSPTGSRRARLPARRRGPGRPAAGRALAEHRASARRRTCPGLFGEVRAAADGVLGARRPRPSGPRRSPRRARPSQAHGDWIDRDARDGDRRLAARPRALRRAASGCGRSTTSTRTRSWRSAGSSCGRNLEGRRAAAPRDRPGRGRAVRVIERVKSRPPGDVRARRSTGTRTSCAGPAPTSSSTASSRSPTTRSIDVIADPRVPAQRDAVRRLLRAGAVRRRQPRPVHRDAGRRRRPERDARALLGLDLEHEHPRGLPGPPPPAHGRVAPPQPDPDAHRRARVRRGLGHVLRADDARGGVRRRRRSSGWRCTPTRSGGRAGSSSTSGCTAAS